MAFQPICLDLGRFTVRVVTFGDKISLPQGVWVSHTRILGLSVRETYIAERHSSQAFVYPSRPRDHCAGAFAHSEQLQPAIWLMTQM